MEGSLVAPYLPVIISVYFKIKNTHKEISRKIAIALNELLIKKTF